MNVPCAQCDYDPRLRVLNKWTVELPFAACSVNEIKSNNLGRSGIKYRLVRDKYLTFLEGWNKPGKSSKCKIFPAHGRRRRVVFTRLFCPPKRLFDSDNLAAGLKPLRDALTRLKLIEDDNPKMLEAFYKQKLSDKNVILVEIQDVEWPRETDKI